MILVLIFKKSVQCLDATCAICLKVKSSWLRVNIAFFMWNSASDQFLDFYRMRQTKEKKMTPFRIVHVQNESHCTAVATLQHTVSSSVCCLPTFKLFRFCFSNQLWILIMSPVIYWCVYIMQWTTHWFEFCCWMQVDSLSTDGDPYVTLALVFIDFCHLCFCNMWRILWSSPG